MFCQIPLDRTQLALACVPCLIAILSCFFQLTWKKRDNLLNLCKWVFFFWYGCIFCGSVVHSVSLFLSPFVSVKLYLLLLNLHDNILPKQSSTQKERCWYVDQCWYVVHDLQSAFLPVFHCSMWGCTSLLPTLSCWKQRIKKMWVGVCTSVGEKERGRQREWVLFLAGQGSLGSVAYGKSAVGKFKLRHSFLLYSWNTLYKLAHTKPRIHMHTHTHNKGHSYGLC